MEYKVLSNKVKIPIIGMGGWAQREQNITNALDAGYRLIDTAAQYENESEVGKAICNSGIPREDIFITTKLWNDDVRSGNVRKAFEESLKKLKTDYVDLYLIHYPADGYIKAWEEICKLYEKGMIRSVGVSNFQPHHINDLINADLPCPMVNQIEEHPYFSNNEVVSFCNKKNIAVEAWCPLGGPGSGVLKDKTIVGLAGKYNKSSAQIILKWQLQRGIICIPKSSKTDHMKNNLEVFDFVLDERDVELIDALNKNERLGADPDNFDF